MEASHGYGSCTLQFSIMTPDHNMYVKFPDKPLTALVSCCKQENLTKGDTVKTKLDRVLVLVLCTSP